MDIKLLQSLNLPNGSWCVVGGASLELRNIRNNKNDIDLLVTDDLYAYCQTQDRWIECALSESGERVTLVLEDSFPPIELLPLEHFIDNKGVTIAYIEKAETIAGLPVIRAQDMLDWKRAANRPKDKKDIVLLKKYLKENS
jgi:hypothetical protein